MESIHKLSDEWSTWCISQEQEDRRWILLEKRSQRGHLMKMRVCILENFEGEHCGHAVDKKCRAKEHAERGFHKGKARGAFSNLEKTYHQKGNSKC